MLETNELTRRNADRNDRQSTRRPLGRKYTLRGSVNIRIRTSLPAPMPPDASDYVILRCQITTPPVKRRCHN
jgi:hypothetical protein